MIVKRDILNIMEAAVKGSVSQNFAGNSFEYLKTFSMKDKADCAAEITRKIALITSEENIYYKGAVKLINNISESTQPEFSTIAKDIYISFIQQMICHVKHYMINPNTECKLHIPISYNIDPRYYDDEDYQNSLIGELKKMWYIESVCPIYKDDMMTSIIADCVLSFDGQELFKVSTFSMDEKQIAKAIAMLLEGSLVTNSVENDTKKIVNNIISGLNDYAVVNVDREYDIHQQIITYSLKRDVVDGFNQDEVTTDTESLKNIVSGFLDSLHLYGLEFTIKDFRFSDHKKTLIEYTIDITCNLAIFTAPT